MTAGVYNAWIEKSLAKLALLMPGRYAKFEASSGFLASVDTYAYRSPGAAVQVVDTDVAPDADAAREDESAAPAPPAAPAEAPEAEPAAAGGA